MRSKRPGWHSLIWCMCGASCGAVERQEGWRRSYSPNRRNRNLLRNYGERFTHNLTPTPLPLPSPSPSGKYSWSGDKGRPTRPLSHSPLTAWPPATHGLTQHVAPTPTAANACPPAPHLPPTCPQGVQPGARQRPRPHASSASGACGARGRASGACGGASGARPPCRACGPCECGQEGALLVDCLTRHGRLRPGARGERGAGGPELEHTVGEKKNREQVAPVRGPVLVGG